MKQNKKKWSSKKILGRTALVLTLGLLLSVLGSGIYLYWLSFSILPKTEGEVVLLEGLTHTVQISRDRWGVPTISAETDRDLYFALGYTLAQDRFWQMDMIRRFALGRLSEILPPHEDILALDRLAKTLGMPLWIKDLKDRLKKSPEHRVVYESIQSFIQGINAWVSQHQDRASIEFWLLDYSPEAFTVEDSLSILAYMAMSLNSSLSEEPLFGNISSQLGKTRTKNKAKNLAIELYPSYLDWEKNPISSIPKTSRITSLKQSSFKKNLSTQNYNSLRNHPVQNSLIPSLHLLGKTGGSNAWVIHPSKSQSNQVLLANDPHLLLGHPSIWYEAKLKSKDLDFHGFFLPLCPFGIIGKNRDIAWGITMVLEDSCDFYKETLKKKTLKKKSLEDKKPIPQPKGKSKINEISENLSEYPEESPPEYLFKGSWEKAQTRKEIIHVHKQDSVEFSVLETSHGPIVSELFDVESLNTAISVRCTFKEKENLAFPTFYRLNRAKNWQDFKEALRFYKAPGIHVVYGDRKGNIGYKAAVAMPIRTVNPAFSIDLLDGTSGKSEWKGFIPFEKQPELFNPKENFIVTANAMSHWQGYEFGPYTELPNRLHRIQALLGSQDLFTLKDLEKIQLDQKAPESTKALLSILFQDLNVSMSNQKSPNTQVQQIEDETVEKEIVVEAIEILKNWDRNQNGKSIASSIYNLWYSQVLKEILKGKIDKKSQELYLKGRFPDRLLESLSKTPHSDWWDDLSTKEKKENRGDLFQKAFFQTLTTLTKERGIPQNWQWNKLQTLDFRHPLVPKKGILGWILKPLFNTGSFPIGGNRQSVNKAHTNYHEPRNVLIGPSMRMLIDFAGTSQFINATGQSGHFNHINYRDQAPLWIEGKYREFSHSPSNFSYKKKKETLLILKPR